MNSFFEEAQKQQEVGNLSRAEQLFRRASSAAAAADDITLQLQILQHLISIAIVREDIHAAVRWLKKTLALQTESNDFKGQADSCLQIGALLFQKGDIPNATAWASQGLNIAETEWSRQHMAEAFHLLGLISLKEDSFDDAVAAFRKAQDVWEEVRDDSGFYESTYQLGVVLQQYGELASAAKEFRKNLTMLAENELELAADLHMRIAEISVEAKWLPEAVLHALAALGRFRKLNSLKLNSALRMLLKLEEKMGETDFHHELKRHLDEESLDKCQHLLDEYVAQEQTEAVPAQNTPKIQEKNEPIEPEKEKQKSIPTFEEKTDIISDLTEKIAPSPVALQPSAVEPENTFINVVPQAEAVWEETTAYPEYPDKNELPSTRSILVTAVLSFLAASILILMWRIF